MTALSRKLGWGSIRPRFEILRKRSCNRFPLCNRVEVMRVGSEGRATRMRFRERHRLSVRAQIFRYDHGTSRNYPFAWMSYFFSAVPCRKREG